jgi:hypothetical protein
MEKELRIALSEQHRNTRHDVISVIQNTVARFEESGNVIPQFFIDEIIKEVMNLKQRIPESNKV